MVVDSDFDSPADSLGFTPHAEDVAVDREAIAGLVDQMLARSHPVVREGMLLAAVPHTFSAGLLGHLRQRNDGHDEKLTDRLARLSFVWPAGQGSDGRLTYAYDRAERDLILQRFIAADEAGYLQAHTRALEYRERHPDPDSFQQVQHRLGHLLIIDESQGLLLLRQTFRTYLDQYRLAALDRLLETAEEAHHYRQLLSSHASPAFGLTLEYLQLRLAQYRGHWAGTLEPLDALARRPDLTRDLSPYVHRARGLALCQTGDYVEAIELLESSLVFFQQQGDPESEAPFTMLALGDAHVGLATAARGYRDLDLPPPGKISWFRRILALPPPPLMFYLAGRGLKPWRPELWPAINQQDWIIARLFGDGARWYRRSIAESEASPQNRLQAQSRLAALTLTMGAAGDALELYRSLTPQQDAADDPYHKALIHAGMGEAHLRLGNAAEALPELKAAQALLAGFDDRETEARVTSLLAETSLAQGEYKHGLALFRQAIQQYEELEDEITVTELAERLRQLAGSLPLDADTKAAAMQLAAQAPTRRYQVRFQHPVLTMFRRLMLSLLVIFVFMVPALTIRVEPSLDLPEISYQVQLPAFEPAGLSASAPNIELIPQFPSEVAPSFVGAPALLLGAVLLVFFIVVYAGIGIFLIFRTPLRSVQAAQERAIRLRPGGIGSGDTHLPLENVTDYVTADIRFLGSPLPNESNTMISSRGQTLHIEGVTSWYTSLQRQLSELLPASARRVDLSFDVLRSWMGFVYLGTLLLLLLFFLATVFAPDLLQLTIPGSGLSLVEAYPFFYLGILIPSLWWIVFQPLRHDLRVHGYSRYARLLILAGLALGIIRLATVRLGLLPLPDFYPGLTALLLLAAGSIGLWRSQVRPGRNLISGVMVLLSLGIIAGLTVHIYNELDAYRHLLAANKLRIQAHRLVLEDPERATMLAEAAAEYEQLVRQIPDYVPGYYHLAAAYTDLGEFNQAVATYDSALETTDHHRAYAGRAVVLQSEAARLQVRGDFAESASMFEASLADINTALDKDPNNLEYRLWRANALQGIGDLQAAGETYLELLERRPNNAILRRGLGWVLYQQAVVLSNEAQAASDAGRASELRERAASIYRDALSQFERAAAGRGDASQSIAAIGAIHYQLGDYEQAIEAWDQVLALDPDNSTALVSRGTAHWHAGRAQGNVCDAPNVPPEEKAAVQNHLQAAAADFSTAAASMPGSASLYRFAALNDYLLRNCPGVDYETSLDNAIGAFSAAIELEPAIATDWQYRARIRYLLWLHQATAQDRDALLVGAAEDILMAAELAPEDAAIMYWQQTIVNDAVEYLYRRGLEALTAGDPALAQIMLAQALEIQPEHPGLYLADGRALLQQGAPDAALESYAAGLTLALEQETYELVPDGLQGLRMTPGGEDVEAIMALFADAASQMSAAAERAQRAELAFWTGETFLLLGNANSAQAWYVAGMALAQETGDLTAIRNAATRLIDLEEAGLVPEQAILGDLSRLVEAIDRIAEQSGDRPDLAFQASLWWLEQNDLELAVLWANRGLERSAASGQFAPLAEYSGQLQEHLADCRTPATCDGATLADFYQALADSLTARQRERPDLFAGDVYWAYRGRFLFDLNQGIFAASPDIDLDPVADASRLREGIVQAGEQAASIAPGAMRLGQRSNQEWADFYRQATIGWYYLRRGEARYEARQYELALGDYVTALNYLTPQSPGGIEHSLEAALSGIAPAFALGDQETAERLLEVALEHIETHGNLRPGAVEWVIRELERLESEQPQLASFGRRLRGVLGGIQ